MLKLLKSVAKNVFVLSQLTCINTYIKYIAEKFHKLNFINYGKSTLSSIVGAEQFTGP